MTAALKPVPRPPERTQSALSRVERPAQTGQITRFPSRAELVQRRQAESQLQMSRPKADHSAIAPKGTQRSMAAPKRITPVRSLPVTQTLPSWLRLLLVLQRASGPIALSLITAALVVYGWTVYVQQIWSHNFHQLESLQRQERDLTAASQVLNQQIAHQAESPEANMTMPGPQNTIFLEPPAPAPASVTEPPTAPVTPPTDMTAPMGY